MNSIKSDALLKKYDIVPDKIASDPKQRAKLKKVFDCTKTKCNIKSNRTGKTLENQRLELVHSSPNMYTLLSITKAVINKSAKTKVAAEVTATATVLPKDEGVKIDTDLNLSSVEEKDEATGTDEPADETTEILASKAVRDYAKEKEIDIETVTGSGANGRISKTDIDNHPTKEEVITV